jgi:hypothetical protein
MDTIPAEAAFEDFEMLLRAAYETVIVITFRPIALC